MKISNRLLLSMLICNLIACDDENQSPTVMPIDMIVTQLTDQFVALSDRNLPMNDMQVVNMNDMQVVNINDMQVVNMNDMQVVNMNDMQVVNMNDMQVVNMNDMQVVNTDDMQVVNTDDMQVVNTDDMQVSGCVEDRFNPNQQSSQSALLAEGVFEDMTLCANTEDWYQVTLCAQGSAFFEINTDANLGDLDVELYDSQMQLIDQDLGTQNQSLVLFETLNAQTLYLKIKGKTATDQNTYQIDFYTSNCRSCQSQNDCHANLGCENQRCIFGACENDRYENNGSNLSATRVQIDMPNTNVVVDQLRLCGQDEDWYVFSVCANADVIVAGTFSGILGNLDMMLYTLNGQNLQIQDQSLAPSGNDELVVYQSTVAQDVYLKVFGSSSDLDLGYQLEIDISNCP